MRVKGRERTYHITDVSVTSEDASIRVDNTRRLSFWMTITLTEKDLRELLEKMEKEKKIANISPIR